MLNLKYYLKLFEFLSYLFVKKFNWGEGSLGLFTRIRRKKRSKNNEVICCLQKKNQGNVPHGDGNQCGHEATWLANLLFVGHQARWLAAFFGVTARWQVGSLSRWRLDLLDCWRAALLAYWLDFLLARWLALRSSGLSVCRSKMRHRQQIWQGHMARKFLKATFFGHPLPNAQNVAKFGLHGHKAFRFLGHFFSDTRCQMRNCRQTWPPRMFFFNSFYSFVFVLGRTSSPSHPRKITTQTYNSQINIKTTMNKVIVSSSYFRLYRYVYWDFSFFNFLFDFMYDFKMTVWLHLFLQRQLTQGLFVLVMRAGRDLLSGLPRPSRVRAPVYRGCPCRDPLGCHRVQDDSLTKRQPIVVVVGVVM